MQARDIDLKKHLPQKYLVALDIARQNSKGELYLIGSAIYGTLARELHGTKYVSGDFDFLVEIVNPTLQAPEGWTIQTNRYGNPKFVHEKLCIDLVQLSSVHHVKTQQLEPTIENYLAGTPLNVQSIAYNVKTDKVHDGGALNAIDNKIISINNYAQAINAAEKKGYDGSLSYLRAIAKELEFQPVYI